MLRAAALTDFESVARACGLDAGALLVEVGLPERCLEEPDLPVPAGRVAALLELAAGRAREPAFGLRMAASRRLSNLGPLGLLLRDQPTLRDALDALARHIHRHNEAVSVSVVEAGHFVAIQEEIVLERGYPVRQAVELAVGTMFRLLTIFLGEGWRPHSVTFRHPAPANRSLHRQVFGPSVRFGQELNAIVCRAADLGAPNPSADPIMARYARGLLQGEPGRHTGMSERVRRLVVLMLPHGNCRMEAVARHLGVSDRTVRNRLAAEYTSFGELIQGVRTDLLEQYRADGQRSLSEVASLLGFSELSAFSRWHRRHFGVAARTVRPAAGASAAGSAPARRSAHGATSRTR